MTSEAGHEHEQDQRRLAAAYHYAASAHDPGRFNGVRLHLGHAEYHCDDELSAVLEFLDGRRIIIHELPLAVAVDVVSDVWCYQPEALKLRP